MPLPAPDLRTNRGTSVVPPDMGPAVGSAMSRSMPTEKYDPNFHGQRLATTCLTLRVRCYQPTYPAPEAYALSGKTERGGPYAIIGGDFDALAEKLPPTSWRACWNSPTAKTPSRW